MVNHDPIAFTVPIQQKTTPQVIRFPVKVGIPGDSVGQAVEFHAIWDTGTTMSIISTDVVQRLNLIDVIDTVGVVTVEGRAEEDADSYFVDVWLPGSIYFPGLQVVHRDKFTRSDMLIGMDIIGRGDSCLTNYKNQAALTFRYPSCEVVDFVADIKKDCPARRQA